MLAPDGVLFEINGTRTSDARLSGAYKTIPRPQPVATTETVPAAAPVVTLPTPPVVPAPVVTPQVVTPASPPAPTVRPVDGGGGGWKKVAIGASALVMLFVVFIWWSVKNYGGDEAVVDSASAAAGEAATADSLQAGWITGFQHVQGPDRNWLRLDGTCRWSEQSIVEGDTTYIDYVQVAGSVNEVELLDRQNMVTLHIPRSGGWVSADSGGGREMVNSGVRVTPVLEAVPAQVPDCEVPVFDR
jgi:hypothetical protein